MTRILPDDLIVHGSAHDRRQMSETARLVARGDVPILHRTDPRSDVGRPDCAQFAPLEERENWALSRQVTLFRVEASKVWLSSHVRTNSPNVRRPALGSM
jgi:hypothetical protein